MARTIVIRVISRLHSWGGNVEIWRSSLAVITIRLQTGFKAAALLSKWNCIVSKLYCVTRRIVVVQCSTRIIIIIIPRREVSGAYNTSTN